MSERSLDMHRRFRAEGKQVGGDLPFGFQLTDAKTRKLVPLPEEAKFLRDAAEQAWAIGTEEGKGVTVGAVVRWMNGPLGCKPRRAKAWSRTTLVQCLTRTPAATAEDVFSPDERASLRTILAAKPGAGQLHRGGKRGVRGSRAGKRIGSGGLLECSGCGSVMHVSPRYRPSGVKVDDYVCSAEPGSCPRGVTVFAEYLDRFLEELYLDECGDDPEEIRRATVAGFAAVEEAKLAVAAALVAVGEDPTAERLADLQAAKLSLQEAEALPQTHKVKWVSTGRTIREAWDAADVVERQLLLRQQWEKVIVRPSTQKGRAYSLDTERLLFVPLPKTGDDAPEVAV